MSTTIVTTAEAASLDLKAHADRINETIDLVVKHEDAFQEATLEPNLLIGLEIARAKELFGMSNAQSAVLGGNAKAAVSRRDTAESQPNPLGFSNWLAREIPRLKRSTALKYATCFHALGIPVEEATPAKIRNKIKDLRHYAGKEKLPMPTLGMLYKQGKPKGKAPLPALMEPEDTKAIRLGDAREWAATWISAWDRGVKDGLLEELPDNEVSTLLDTVKGIADHLKLRTTKKLPR